MSKPDSLSKSQLSDQFIEIVVQEASNEIGCKWSSDFLSENKEDKNIVTAQDNQAIKIVFYGSELKYWELLNEADGNFSEQEDDGIDDEEDDQVNQANLGAAQLQTYQDKIINFELANFLIQNGAELDLAHINKTFPYILEKVSDNQSAASREVLKYFIKNLQNLDEAAQSFYHKLLIDSQLVSIRGVFGLFSDCVKNLPEASLQDEFNQRDDNTNSCIANFLFHKIFKNLHEYNPQFGGEKGVFAKELIIEILRNVYDADEVDTKLLDVAYKLYSSSVGATAFYEGFFEANSVAPEYNSDSKQDKANIEKFQEFVLAKNLEAIENLQSEDFNFEAQPSKAPALYGPKDAKLLSPPAKRSRTDRAT